MEINTTVPSGPSQWMLILIINIIIGHFGDGMVMVRAPSPKVATMGKDPLSIECLYRVTGNDRVLGVNWYRKQSYDSEYFLIAQVPNKEFVSLPPTFVEAYLSKKANISTEKKGSFESVQLVISPTDCQDEGTYQCEVQVYGGRTPRRPNVVVHLNEEPSPPTLKQSPEVLVENYPVTFTCTGTMGRPISNFKWYVYKNTHRDMVEEIEMSGITSFDKTTGSCSPIGSSTLAIMITQSDQKVKCVIQQHSQQHILKVSDERQLDVQYSVRDTEVRVKVNRKYRNAKEEIQTIEGDTVELFCNSHGNPEPEFSWSYLPLHGHLDGNGLKPFSEKADLSITNVTTNHSASYVCVSSNIIRGRKHSETRAVRIIVKERLSAAIGHLQRVTHTTHVLRYVMIGGIVLGAMLFVILLSLLSVMCYKRCVRMEDQKYLVQYHGVKTSHPLP